MNNYKQFYDVTYGHCSQVRVHSFHETCMPGGQNDVPPHRPAQP